MRIPTGARIDFLGGTCFSGYPVSGQGCFDPCTALRGNSLERIENLIRHLLAENASGESLLSPGFFNIFGLISHPPLMNAA